MKLLENYKIGVLLLTFVLINSIFQFFIFKVGYSYLPLNIAIIPIVGIFILNYLKEFFKIDFIVWLSLLILTFAISIIWGHDLKAALKQIIWYLFFIILFFGGWKFYKNENLFIKSINIYFLFLLIFVFLVIYFRINQGAYGEFIHHSKIAHFFINQNLLLHRHISWGRSGAFFLSPNPAAIFLGMNYFLAMGLFISYKRLYYLILSFFIAVGIVAVNSKAGILILILFNLVFFIMFWKNKIIRFFYLVIFILSIIGSYEYKSNINSFHSKTEHTLDIRLHMWKYGINQMPKHLLKGFGYGGWDKNYGEYAKKHNLNFQPPHNTFIFLWSNSGIFAIIFALGFIYSIIKFGIKLFLMKNEKLKGYSVILLFSFGWVFLQGMGENSGLIGDEHMISILAIVLGFIYGQYKSSMKNG